MAKMVYYVLQSKTLEVPSHHRLKTLHLTGNYRRWQAPLGADNL
jgi:hypothetical protein